LPHKGTNKQLSKEFPSEQLSLGFVTETGTAARLIDLPINIRFCSINSLPSVD